MNRLFCLFILLLPSLLFAQQGAKAIEKDEIRIEYQKRQKVDLGALMIEGQVVAPTDFSIDDEKNAPSSKIYRRKNYNDRLKLGIEEVM